MDTGAPDQQSNLRGEIPSLAPAVIPAKIRPHWLRRAALLLLWIILFAVALWAFGALWFDFPEPGWGRHVATAFAVALLAALVFSHGTKRRLAILAVANLGVLAWWFTLEPFNERNWQADVAQTAWAEISGDLVTLHNVRNCDYRSETAYTPRWETRTVDLSKLTGMDIAITYWGSPFMAHPIFSFQFEDALPVCFSIETRKEQGEAYSAIGGLYRQYELIYICADERDVIRLRSNFRKGEDVYLYRTTAPAAAVRQRFLEYVAMMNALHKNPRWYNAITTNCTTSIRGQRAVTQRAPWDWRILVNGYGDEMMAEHGALAGGLPFPQLKARALINDAARAAGDAPDFSRRIRAGRPGFAPL